VVAQDAAVVMGDPTIDAVVIATPTSSHYALVKAALEAGKHVLVEKPITTHSGEADELVALAERAAACSSSGTSFFSTWRSARARGASSARRPRSPPPASGTAPPSAPTPPSSVATRLAPTR
jgi:hypothetical protein